MRSPTICPVSWPLPAIKQRIARLQPGDRGPDRLGAVADFPGALGGAEDRGADRLRIFAARIVVGDDDAVGIFGGDRAHQRTLAGIAVAAGAEHHHQLAFRIRPQRLQRLRQRIGLVRVVDKDRRAVAFADPLQPALGAFKMFAARRTRLRARCRCRSQARRRPAHSRSGIRRPAAAGSHGCGRDVRA